MTRHAKRCFFSPWFYGEDDLQIVGFSTSEMLRGFPGNHGKPMVGLTMTVIELEEGHDSILLNREIVYE